MTPSNALGNATALAPVALTDGLCNTVEAEK